VEAWTKNPSSAAIHRFLLGGWGFDRVYDALFVRPFRWVATVNRKDFVDRLYGAIALIVEALHCGLSLSQTGKVRQYAAGIAIGAAVAVGIVVFF
jgi:NADH-quinone oxidoreductase subunit L